MTKKANDTQVGGDHYRKKPIQHWDFVGTNQHSYLGGQVSKYLCRWKDKNGVQDVDKAVHFLDKLIEVMHQAEIHPIPVHEFLEAQETGHLESSIIMAVHAYEETGDVSYLLVAKEAAAELQRQAHTIPHQQV
jgi:hypothetical protein